ncbi:chromatin/chromatin-binding, or -regulatory protein [Lithospermum erythrorhizon]|uniref:Chromatin/chromatin-binding, or -regulatory protein n=1 Tax=Lithospermum erythrorhizon TaxID=34254 RepID=A0AAV3NXS3_LITER
MEEAINRIVSDLESQTPISEPFLKDFQNLLDYTINTTDTVDIEAFYNELSSRNVSITVITSLIAETMDPGPTHVAILASKVYLSLILIPNSPVFTLFTPVAFLSMIRAVRRGFKNPIGGSGGGDLGKRKKGGGGLGKGKRKAKNGEFSGGEGEERGLDVRELLGVLELIEKALSLVHLSRFCDCMKSLVQSVTEIVVLAGEGGGFGVGVYGRLCEVCARILSEILKEEHGDQGVTSAEVLKALTPLILFVKSQAKGFALEFVVNRMVSAGRNSSEIMKSVVNLPKYLVNKAPEKADGRALAVESIMEVVKVLDFEYQTEFADFVVKMSQGKGQFRLLAVDLVPTMIMSLKSCSRDEIEEGDENPWWLKCLEALVQRCSDATAGIRARALTNLAQLIGFLSQNEKRIVILKELMGFAGTQSNRTDCGITDLLRKRCMDDKAAVRKAALFLTSKIISMLGGPLDEDLLKTVGMTCSDPLVSIRKAAISALSEAFRIFSEGDVIKEWLHSVPRLIGDNETSVQEECENLFLELVLDRVSKAGSTSCAQARYIPSDSNGGKGPAMDIESEYPEGVLLLLKEICDSEVTPWVKKICTSLGKKKKLKPKIAVALQNIIRASESLWISRSMHIENWTAPPGAWFLLSEVSLFLPKAVEWEFLLHNWQLLDKYQPDDNNHTIPMEQDVTVEMLDVECNSMAWAVDRVFLLQTISNVSVELPPEPAADLAHDFLRRLEEFNMHSTEVSAHIKALRTVCKRKALNTDEADTLVLKWVGQLLSKAAQILETCMSEHTEKNKGNVFRTPRSGTSGKGKRAAETTSKVESKAVTALYTIGSLVIVCPSADLKSMLPILHSIVTSGDSIPEPSSLPSLGVSIKQTAPSLYIHAWLTMGKICLADDKLAKRYIPLFVQELEKSENAAQRNNIVVMMADFCVRYTALVDCYMSKITKCLRDPCELVRLQTFILLSRLLQRDYVKWKGILFLRFLLSLVDESEKIRQLADFLFGNILKVKAPLLAYNSFVESVFVLNDCNAHTGSSNRNSSRTERSLFSLRGNDDNSRSRRMHIYTTLLKQMAPEHLLATFAKICAEILAAAADGMLKLEDAAGQSVLQDAFAILCCKEIRLPSQRGSSSDSAEAEEGGPEEGAASSSAARGKITQAVKKGLIQNTIPIFIELKRLLESKNSPLNGSLMDCLRILLKEYKNEIDDMLIADKQLQKELIYDMQRFETMKAKSTAAEAVATMRSPVDQKIPSSVLLKSTITGKLQHTKGVASAVADAVAAVTARSVLRDVNKGKTPPLGEMSVPKLKSRSGDATNKGERAAHVIESLRRRQFFDSSDDENCPPTHA